MNRLSQLIDQGVDVNCVDQKHQNTPLLLLCSNPNYNEDLLTCLDILLTIGHADINCKNSRGRNALLVACLFSGYRNLIDVLRFLIDKGIDVDARDTIDNWNALYAFGISLMTGRRSNLLEIIRLLVDSGCDVNAVIYGGGNILQNLCCYYQEEDLIEIIRMLIAKGIDVNCRNFENMNALLVLSDHNSHHPRFFDIVRLLLESGIDVNCVNHNGVNVLFYLCIAYQRDDLIDLIRLLIEHGLKGIDWSMAINILEHRCPLKEEKKKEIIKLLLKQ